MSRDVFNSDLYTIPKLDVLWIFLLNALTFVNFRRKIQRTSKVSTPPSPLKKIKRPNQHVISVSSISLLQIDCNRCFFVCYMEKYWTNTLALWQLISFVLAPTVVLAPTLVLAQFRLIKHPNVSYIPLELRNVLKILIWHNPKAVKQNNCKSGMDRFQITKIRANRLFLITWQTC